MAILTTRNTTERGLIISRMQEVGWRFDRINFQVQLWSGKECVISLGLMEMPSEIDDLSKWLWAIYSKLGKSYKKEKLVKYIITGSY